MDHLIECTSVADYNSIIEDTISTENTIIYYVRNNRNNMYELEHCINHEYVNDDEPLTVRQYDNIMIFLVEIS